MRRMSMKLWVAAKLPFWFQKVASTSLHPFSLSLILSPSFFLSSLFLLPLSHHSCRRERERNVSLTAFSKNLFLIIIHWKWHCVKSTLPASSFWFGSSLPSLFSFSPPFPLFVLLHSCFFADSFRISIEREWKSWTAATNLIKAGALKERETENENEYYYIWKERVRKTLEQEERDKKMKGEGKRKWKERGKENERRGEKKMKERCKFSPLLPKEQESSWGWFVWRQATLLVFLPCITSHSFSLLPLFPIKLRELPTNVPSLFISLSFLSISLVFFLSLFLHFSFSPSPSERVSLIQNSGNEETEVGLLISPLLHFSLFFLPSSIPCPLLLIQFHAFFSLSPSFTLFFATHLSTHGFQFFVCFAKSPLTHSLSLSFSPSLSFVIFPSLSFYCSLSLSVFLLPTICNMCVSVSKSITVLILLFLIYHADSVLQAWTYIFDRKKLTRCFFFPLSLPIFLSQFFSLPFSLPLSPHLFFSNRCLRFNGRKSHWVTSRKEPMCFGRVL